jgi:hypothetical protein
MRAFLIAAIALTFSAAAVDTSSAQSARDRMERRMMMKGKMMDRAKHPGMHQRRHGGGMHVRGRADMR